MNNISSTSFLRTIFNNLTISFAGSALTYISYMYMAYQFGAKSETDIFLFAVSFVVLMSALITTVISSIFLPTFIKLRHHQGGSNESIQFASAFFSWLLVITILIGAGIGVFTVDLFSLASKFPQGLIESSERLLNYFALIFIFTVINEFFRILLQAHGEFTVPAISIVIQPAVTIACIYLLASSFNIESLAIATLASRIIQFIYIYLSSIKKGIVLHISFKKDDNLNQFISNAYIYWLSSIVTMFSAFFFDYTATGLSSGSLTSISYAQKIYLLPIMILAMPLLETLNTKFSELYVRNEHDALRRLYENVVSISLFIMAPLSVILAILSNSIVQLLFVRGAFTQENANIAATCLSIYAISIPFIVWFSINGRITLALQKTKLPSVLGLMGHLLMIVATWLLVEQIDYVGIPLARTGVEFLFFLPFGFLCVYFYLGGINFLALFVESAKIVVASLLAVLPIYFVILPWLQNNFESAIGELVLNTLLFFFFYYFTCKLFALKSLVMIEGKIRTKLNS